MAQSLSDAGYATGMWGKWHLGSDPNARSPIDFGFDEAVWSPRTADEVLWTMQSYFPNGSVEATPYMGDTKIPLTSQTIYSRKKGEPAEPVATYDAEFRAAFDRKITNWAIDDGDEPTIVADGKLAVDGRVIYTMRGFALRLRRDPKGARR